MLHLTGFKWVNLRSDGHRDLGDLDHQAFFAVRTSIAGFLTRSWGPEPARRVRPVQA
jgi:hypothetical protein